MRLVYTASKLHVPLPGYTVVGSDISFAAADSSINSSTTDLAAGLEVGRYIRITGSGQNDGWYTVASIVSANKITVAETIADEAAGAVVELAGFIHRDGDEYTIECHAARLDPVRERDITVQEAPDRSVEVIEHYVGDRWVVETDVFDQSLYPYYREFLGSTEAYETFQIDLYGYAASPGELLACHAVKPAEIRREGARMEYRMSFTVRVIE